MWHYALPLEQWTLRAGHRRRGPNAREASGCFTGQPKTKRSRLHAIRMWGRRGPLYLVPLVTATASPALMYHYFITTVASTSALKNQCFTTSSASSTTVPPSLHLRCLDTTLLLQSPGDFITNCCAMAARRPLLLWLLHCDSRKDDYFAAFFFCCDTETQMTLVAGDWVGMGAFDCPTAAGLGTASVPGH